MKYIKTYNKFVFLNEDLKETPQYSSELLELVKDLKLTYEFEEDNQDGNFELSIGYFNQNEVGKSKIDNRYKIIIDDSDEKPFWVYKGEKLLNKESNAKSAILRTQI